MAQMARYEFVNDCRSIAVTWTAHGFAFDATIFQRKYMLHFSAGTPPQF
jgi:hypothetical protein